MRIAINQIIRSICFYTLATNLQKIKTMYWFFELIWPLNFKDFAILIKLRIISGTKTTLLQTIFIGFREKGDVPKL